MPGQTHEKAKLDQTLYSQIILKKGPQIFKEESYQTTAEKEKGLGA